MRKILLYAGVLVAIIIPSVASAEKRDTTSPVIASHANVVVMVNGVTGSTVTYANPTATDNVDGAVPVVCAPASGSTFALGATTVTCSAHDAAGNIATKTFKVTVDDDTPPVVTVARLSSSDSSSTLAVVGDTVTLSFTTSENIQPPIILVNSHMLLMRAVGSNTSWQGSYVVQNNDPLGKVAYLVTAADIAKNITACSNIRLPFINYCPPIDGSSVAVVKSVPVDHTPPVIAPHDNSTAEATSPQGATVTYTFPMATDNSNNPVAVDCVPASGSTFHLGSTDIICTAADGNGNAATPTHFQIIVRDTTAPTIDPHADISVAATDSAGATVSYNAPVASDIVDGSDTVSCLPASGSQFSLGTTTVTCSASDVAGNQSHSTFNVGVYSVFTASSPVVDTLDTFAGWTTFANDWAFDDGSDGQCHKGGCLTTNGVLSDHVPSDYKTGTPQINGAMTFWSRYKVSGSNFSGPEVFWCVGGLTKCDHWSAFAPNDDTWHQYYVAWRDNTSAGTKEFCTMSDDTNAADCLWQTSSRQSLGDASDTIVLTTPNAGRYDLGDGAWFDDLESPGN